MIIFIFKNDKKEQKRKKREKNKKNSTMEALHRPASMASVRVG